MCRGIFMPGAMGFTLFQCQINIAILSTRLYVVILQQQQLGFVLQVSCSPLFPRLQSSKQKRTIFSPGNRSPSSHKAKQNYAMSQDNVLGMWSLALSTHIPAAAPCRRAAQNGGEASPSTSQTPQLCCGKKEWQNQNKVPKNGPLKSSGPWH